MFTLDDFDLYDEETFPGYRERLQKEKDLADFPMFLEWMKTPQAQKWIEEIWGIELFGYNGGWWLFSQKPVRWMIEGALQVDSLPTMYRWPARCFWANVIWRCRQVVLEVARQAQPEDLEPLSEAVAKFVLEQPLQGEVNDDFV